MPILATTGFWDITIGNVATIVMGVIVWGVTLAMLWQKFNDRLDSTSKQTEKNTAELDQLTKLALQTSVAQHERRLQELEKAVGQIAGISATLEFIKDQFDVLLQRR